MRNITQDCKLIRHSNAVAAGATAITPSAGIDTAGFDAVTFIAMFGAIVTSAVTSVKVQQSDDDGVSDGYSDLEGSSVSVADDDDNQIVAVEIIRPQKRYLKMIVSRATANATLDGIVAILHSGNVSPTTHDATTVVGSELHWGPAEGTA